MYGEDGLCIFRDWAVSVLCGMSDEVSISVRVLVQVTAVPWMARSPVLAHCLPLPLLYMGVGALLAVSQHQVNPTNALINTLY